MGKNRLDHDVEIPLAIGRGQQGVEVRAFAGKGADQ